MRLSNFRHLCILSALGRCACMARSTGSGSYVAICGKGGCCAACVRGRCKETTPRKRGALRAPEAYAAGMMTAAKNRGSLRLG